MESTKHRLIRFIPWVGFAFGVAVVVFTKALFPEVTGTLPTEALHRAFFKIVAGVVIGFASLLAMVLLSRWERWAKAPAIAAWTLMVGAAVLSMTGKITCLCSHDIGATERRSLWERGAWIEFRRERTGKLPSARVDPFGHSSVITEADDPKSLGRPMPSPRFHERDPIRLNAVEYSIFSSIDKDREVEVGYFPDEAEGWILTAPGPDMIPEITVDVIRSGEIIKHTYDPTNGFLSPGDVVVRRRDLDGGQPPFP